MDLQHRPHYHFTSLANFMNDPTGLIQWKGRYHLLYQHNPHGAVSVNKHKGHAVSDDLVHWTHLPIALAPTPGGPDQASCATGCIVVQDGVPTLVYSAFRNMDPLIESVCVATTNDDLLTWTKFAGNPVIQGPPPGMNLTGFRDPCIWREDDQWYMTLGSGLKGVGGAVLLYRSPDLRNWEYLQPILVGDVRVDGHVWECPNIFPLHGKHVLVISWCPRRQCAYYVGTLRDGQFLPEGKGLVDLSNTFYAAQTMLDDRGRRIMFGWLQEGRSKQAQEAAGWSGIMSLPQVLSLDAMGRLVSEPAAEVETLRGARHHYDLELQANVDRVLDLRSDSVEIVATFAPGRAQRVGLKLRCSPDGQEQSLLVYDSAKGTLAVDRRRAGATAGAFLDVQEGAIALGADGALQLRVFLDASALEVFANHRQYMGSRIYPTRPDSLGIAAFAEGGDARAVLDVWEMKSIWSA